MTRHKQFIDRAETQLKMLRSELDALEKTIKAKRGVKCRQSKSLMRKLWNEWRLASATIDGMSKRAQGRGRASINQLKADAESHWLALETVVATYRGRLQGRAANA